MVNRGGPLHVECAVILGHRVLAIGFLAHFYVTDRVSAFFEVGDLSSCVVGSSVEHGDRNHCRQIVGNSTGEEQIESAVLVIATIAHVLS